MIPNPRPLENNLTYFFGLGFIVCGITLGDLETGIKAISGLLSIACSVLYLASNRKGIRERAKKVLELLLKR